MVSGDACDVVVLWSWRWLRDLSLFRINIRNYLVYRSLKIEYFGNLATSGNFFKIKN